MKLFAVKQNINWAAIGIIFIACLMANFVLRYGLPLNTTTELQMDYISENENLWHLAWLSWNMAAIGLFVFSIYLYRESKKSLYAKFGLFLVFLGLLPDLTAEYMLSFKLSAFAKENSISEFKETEELAMQLMGLYANGLYNLGGLILTLVLFKEQFLPKYLAFFGFLSWCFGLTLSLFMFLNDMASSEWASAVAMSLNLIFMAWVNVLPEMAGLDEVVKMRNEE